jgi:hypothetical protein
MPLDDMIPIVASKRIKSGSWKAIAAANDTLITVVMNELTSMMLLI